MAEEEFQEREEEGDSNLREEILVHPASSVSSADLLHEWFDSLACRGPGSGDSDGLELGVGVCSVADAAVVFCESTPSSGSSCGSGNRDSFLGEVEHELRFLGATPL